MLLAFSSFLSASFVHHGCPCLLEPLLTRVHSFTGCGLEWSAHRHQRDLLLNFRCWAVSSASITSKLGWFTHTRCYCRRHHRDRGIPIHHRYLPLVATCALFVLGPDPVLASACAQPGWQWWQRLQQLCRLGSHSCQMPCLAQGKHYCWRSSGHRCACRESCRNRSARFLLECRCQLHPAWLCSC